MVFNITYPSKALSQKIADIVGPAYTMFQRFKMKGIGTSKMQLFEISPDMEAFVNIESEARYCYLELRPKGMIVGFQSMMRTYVWAIPFRYLKIYNNSGLLSIYDNQSFMKMKPPFNGSVDKGFIKKVLEFKAEYYKDTDFRNP